MKTSYRWLFLFVVTLLFAGSASGYYDPRIGRWLSRDPIGEDGGFNLYAYCGNDPVNKHDPTGLDAMDPRALPWLAPQMRAALDENDREQGRRTAEHPWLNLAPFAIPAVIATLPEDAVAAIYAGAFRLGTWFFAEGGESTVAMWGTRTALTLGAGTVAYDGLNGASPFNSFQDGAGTFFNITAFTGIGNPNLRMPTFPSWRPQWNPLNYRLLPTGTGTGGLNFKRIYRQPRLGVPSPEVYKTSLPTAPTPTSGPEDLFEIANTGPMNYLIKGGGVEFWADGIMGTTIQESKYIINPGRSPFIPNSGIPSVIRNKIISGVDQEFSRAARIIRDPTNPLIDMEVIVNDPRANQFFLDLLKKHGINGRVINR
jgi:hypothetical protein